MMRSTFRSRAAGAFLAGRLVLIAAAATLAAALYGGTELAAVLKNRAPLEVGYVAYTRDRPDSDWLHIPDGQLDWDSYMYEEKRSKITRVFVPLRAPDWAPPEDGLDESTPIHVLVEMDGDSARSRASMDRMLGMTSLGAVGGAEQRPVEGMLRFGVNSSSKERRELEGLSPALTRDFVVLQLGERPQALKAFVLLAGALIGGGLLVFLARGGSRSKGLPTRRRAGEDAPAGRRRRPAKSARSRRR